MDATEAEEALAVIEGAELEYCCSHSRSVGCYSLAGSL